jgi:xanthine/uracil/vitamin C permease (AzgA family)
MGRSDRVHPGADRRAADAAFLSIATGIGLGFIAYVALKALAGRFSEINAAVGIIALAFLLKLIFA